MRAVVDTNVLVSRFLSPNGAPARVFELWESQVFALVVSQEVLDEYRRALSYEHVANRHGLGPAEVNKIVEAIRELAIFVNPASSSRVIDQDPDDDKFLACALAGEAEYIVSGDRHLLALGRYEGVEILSPAAFLEAVNAD